MSAEAQHTHSALLDQAIGDAKVEVRVRDVQRVVGLLLDLHHNGTLGALVLVGVLDPDQANACAPAVERLGEAVCAVAEQLLTAEAKVAIRRAAEARHEPTAPQEPS